MIAIFLAAIPWPAFAQDSDVDAVVELEIFGRRMAPSQLSFILRTDPEFEKVMLRQTYASQILNPIDKEEFEEGISVSQRSIDNPLLWLATGAGIASGITAGYMDANSETLNANWLAGTAGVALLAAAVIMLVD
ncbi:MAG: hypothetical protein A2Y64_01860 [Candidatus Coatesbacteria bacterium RBG_13_66_14]|uniref:Uncharacterized protein n=1 Tax=Candidatus Coatesbacteria bacterium RBG_13_66_14 TaxID=1817816 RepID=A0A1F5F4A7_9BACT|nr:MAG: hypothetical protein A2Y64_01860 [Candidatus Coatesbacteria bacterium RBG_13_66_14]